MFLMATSAIGPGFITQTTTFTGATGRRVRLRHRRVDPGRHRAATERLAGDRRLRPARQELGNLVAPGLGWLMAALLFVGGLVFNIGNVSGAGLGTDAMFGLDPKVGGALSALVAIGIFLSRRAGLAMDRIVVALGALMIGLTTYIAITSGPPVGAALKNVVLPEQVEFLAITTLIGGTIGGYIVYAGAHRLLDSGVSGPEHVHDITRGSVTGILITGVMRIVLFLAILGVVSGGATLDPKSQGRIGVPAVGGRGRASRLRHRAVGGGDHQRHRRLLHHRLLHHLPDADQRPAADRAGGGLHRADHRDLRLRRHGPHHAAGVRRRVQRPAAAGGDRCASLGRMAAQGPAERLPVPGLAARHRRRGLAPHHLPRGAFRPSRHRPVQLNPRRSHGHR
jgi:hypothetical protein